MTPTLDTTLDTTAPTAVNFPVPTQGLPPVVQEHANALSEWGQPEAAAGLCVRWAQGSKEASGDALSADALSWWNQQSEDVREEVEGLILTGAVQFVNELEQLQGERLAPATLEQLALRRDALASASALLFAGQTGATVRRTERSADKLLAILMDQQPMGLPYVSPVLDALARRDLGWWTVAPGSPRPPLDEDTFIGVDQADRDLIEDLEALDD